MVTCKYCQKEFRKESTLSAHLCEPRRRWQQENEAGVRLGFNSYLQFYVETQGSAKTKTYADFVASPYYSAFVKYGQYLIQIRAIDPAGFTKTLLKNNQRLDHWTKEVFYDEYLYELLRKEHPTVALERSLTEMQKWADAENKSFNDIFRVGAPNKICSMIVNGRISPWIIFNCDSGVEFLAGLNDEQVALVFKFIDPAFWQRKLKDYIADAEYIKEVLMVAKV